MSAIVGTGPDGSGKLKCYIHDFETLDSNEFAIHCEETGHTLSGSTVCSGGCGSSVDFNEIPYKKDLKVMCPDCFNNLSESHTNMQNKLRVNNKQQQQQQTEVTATQ